MFKPATAIIFLAGAFPAVAQNAPSSSPTATSPAATQNPLDKVICKTDDTLGTRLGAHRVCATLREWKDQEDLNRSAAQDIMQRDSGLCGEGCGPPH